MLPAKFQHVPSIGSADSLVEFNPHVFVSPEDDSVRLTWMVADFPVKPEIARQFALVTAVPGPIAPVRVLPVVQRIFPVIGELDEAMVVELRDRARSLELIETYFQPAENRIKRGYQMVICRSQKFGAPSHFERLCLYALPDKFEKLITAIRSSARSFQYY